MTTPIDKLAALARREHEPKCYELRYSTRCTCGATAHNAELDAVLAELGEVRVMYRAADLDGNDTFRLFETLSLLESSGSYLVIELRTGKAGETETP